MTTLVVTPPTGDFEKVRFRDRFRLLSSFGLPVLYVYQIMYTMLVKGAPKIYFNDINLCYLMTKCFLSNNIDVADDASLSKFCLPQIYASLSIQYVVDQGTVLIISRMIILHLTHTDNSI